MRVEELAKYVLVGWIVSEVWKVVKSTPLSVLKDEFLHDEWCAFLERTEAKL